MSRTGYLSIGNSDNKLSQYQWSEFCRELDKETRVITGNSVFGPFYTPSHSPYQSMSIGFVLPEDSVEEYSMVLALEEMCSGLCTEYGQDSIAFVSGPAAFFTSTGIQW